jgi:hypothetical protein
VALGEQNTQHPNVSLENADLLVERFSGDVVSKKRIAGE